MTGLSKWPVFHKMAFFPSKNETSYAFTTKAMKTHLNFTVPICRQLDQVVQRKNGVLHQINHPFWRDCCFNRFFKQFSNFLIHGSFFLFTMKALFVVHFS